MPKTLYICYFGLRQPLVQTQVIAYLLEIIKDGVEVSLLTFEPDLAANWTKQQIETEQRSLLEKGIEWHQLAYHKRPSVPATFYDILNGALHVRKLTRTNNFDVLHCRVHVPALMGAIARKLSRRKPKLLFDIRGFFPEEYTDAGIWPEGGWLYRTVKRVEKWLMKEADGFVVLTEKASEILFPEISGDDKTPVAAGSAELTAEAAPGSDRYGRPVEVIPCCVDLKRFERADKASREEMRDHLAVRDRMVIAYIGSFDGWYLSDEMFDFFATARDADPSVFVLALTQGQTATVVDRLKAKGFGDSDFLVGSVTPSEIPRYLSAADMAVSFIKRCYSKQASSPTKNAEYLASGLPIIVNSGVGDVDLLISEDGVGVVVDGFGPDDFRDAIQRLTALGDVGDRCRESTRKRFDLESVGGRRYRRIYKRLLG